jgi:hypothetical protein
MDAYILSSSFRNLIACVYIPVIQKELDYFRMSVWNSHRIRKQRNKELPAGIPDHIYSCPEKYGGQKCGFNLTDEDLREVADLSEVLDGTNDYIHPDFRHECEQHIPNTDDIEPAQAANAFLYLKANINAN